MRKCKCGKPANYLKKNRKFLCDACAQKLGYLQPCTGEAHKNPFIDNCMVCMPRWGLMEVDNAIKQFDAWAEGLM